MLRLQFAKTHRPWTVDDSKRVIWSEEARFQRHQMDGIVRVCHRPYEAVYPTCRMRCTGRWDGGPSWAVFT